MSAPPSSPPDQRAPVTGGIPPLFKAPTLIRTKSGRTLVLGLAIITMIVEMGSLLIGQVVHIGRLPLSASILPSLALLAALGARAAGRPGDRERLVPFWIAVAAGLGLGAVLFHRTGDLTELFGLVVAATNEEVVYRFAVPVVITSALMVVRVPSGPARLVGYVTAGVWWILLPGHQAQTDSAVTLVTFAAFAGISALVVARSRALIPMAAAHCVLNVITLAQLRGEISVGGRSALCACLLFLLIGTFAWPGDRAIPAGGDRRRSRRGAEDLVSDTVIDLRDGQRASVRRGDEITWMDDPAPSDEREGVSSPPHP